MRNEELNIQISIINHARMKGVEIFSIPNGANFNSPSTRNLMKLSGLTSGVADLQILLYKRSIFVEVKTEKKTSKQSDNQKQFEIRVNELGFEYYVVRSLEEFIELFNKIINKNESFLI